MRNILFYNLRDHFKVVPFVKTAKHVSCAKSVNSSQKTEVFLQSLKRSHTYINIFKEVFYMKQINKPAELEKHILECAAKEKVYAGNDSYGNFIQVVNLEPFILSDKKGQKKVGKEKSFKVYEKGNRISFANGQERLKTIKSENSEISEHIKLPEKEKVVTETLIADINQSIQTCQFYIRQMDLSAVVNDSEAFKAAQSKLRKEIDKLDEKTMQLAASKSEGNLYASTIVLINISNARVEFEKALQRDMTIQEYNKNLSRHPDIRENPYALHLKAMMEIKENLGNDELRGTIGNVNGVVQKSGFGQETRNAMDTANKNQQEAGATAVRDDVQGPKNDTTYEEENVDIDDILKNGPTSFSPRFFGVAIEEQEQNTEMPERTLI